MSKKRKKSKKKARKTNKKKRFKKRSLRIRRRRIGKSKKRQKKKVKQLRRKKVRSKKTKRRKSFFQKARTGGFKKSIKKRFSFSLRELFKKFVSPIVDGVRDYQKKRQLLKSRKIKEEEKRKQKEIKVQSDLRKEILKKEIKEEKAIAKTRVIELKNFLREEQKLIREKEKTKQEKFLEEVRLEKTLEKFRKRELSEIQAIEKYTLNMELNIEKEDFKAFQQRIDQVKEKYKALRNERLRKRVEELGVTLSDQATVEEIRQKEKEYIQRRELIETSLESFVRSATSLIYQINKRYLPRNADLLRVINLVYEQSEIIIREDQEQNENFLMLIYVKDQDVDKNLIIVEDKTNPEKHETREYNRSQIFKFGDDLADSMVRYLEGIRERSKKAS